MTEAAPKAPEFKMPPHGIAPEPFDLDGVTFTPFVISRMEQATRDGNCIGHVLLDDDRFWFARKLDASGNLSDWKEMRCVHEARAFIVSRNRK